MTQHQSTVHDGLGIPSETRWSLPNGFGSMEMPVEESLLPKTVGTVSYVPSSLRPGLEVYTFKAAFKSLITMSSEVLTGKDYLWLSFNISGLGAYRQGHNINGALLPDWSYCGIMRDPVTDLVHPPGDCRTVGMVVSSDRLREMLRGQRLNHLVDDFLDGRFDPQVAAFRSTAALRGTIHQICSHPYHGAMADMFLEAKAFEMLAESLRVVTDDSLPAETGRTRRYAMAAREIIMADLSNPPRIEDVANQVGLSQRQLNEVFREVFDASPFQCLVHWRLDLARRLLAIGELTVKQVAHQTGYAHVSNFSLAFTRRFGHPPSDTPRE